MSVQLHIIYIRDPGGSMNPMTAPVIEIVSLKFYLYIGFRYVFQADDIFILEGQFEQWKLHPFGIIYAANSAIICAETLLGLLYKLYDIEEKVKAFSGH
jgi:hypothetical protein